MAKKTLADLHGPALSRFSGMFRCQQELMRITPVIWKNETSLFGRTRGVALEAVDRELKLYHDYGMTNGLTTVDSIENLAIRAVTMYYALKTWKDDRSDKDPKRTGPDSWKYSTRNAHGSFERLDDVLTRSMRLTSEYSTASSPPTEVEWFVTQQREYANQFYDLFKGAKMIAKSSFLREKGATVAAATAAFVGEQTGLTSVVQGGLSSAGSAVASTVRSGVSSASSAVTSSVSRGASSDEAQFMAKIAAMVVEKFGIGDAVAGAMREAVKGLGIAEKFMVDCLRTAAAAVGKAVYETLKAIVPIATLLASGAEAAKAFYKALKAHMAGRKGKRNRYAIREGSVSDAYNTIVNFWDEERNENLKEAGTAAVKAIVSGVCSAIPGGSAVTAVTGVIEKAYTACKAVWDTLNKVLDMVEEVVTVNEKLAHLDAGANSNAKDIFEISPLLATYYFLSLETGAIVMLDCKLMTMRGFMDVVERLKSQVDPVIDKAAEYLGEHGFMFVRANGKPLPVRAKLGNPSLKEQIEEAAKSTVTDTLTDAGKQLVGIEDD